MVYTIRDLGSLTISGFYSFNALAIIEVSVDICYEGGLLRLGKWLIKKLRKVEMEIRRK